MCGIAIKLLLSFLLSYEVEALLVRMKRNFLFPCSTQCFNLLFIGFLLSSIAPNRSHLKPEGILNSLKWSYSIQELLQDMKIIYRKRVQRNKVYGKRVLTAEGELMLLCLFWRLTLGDKHICLDENFCTSV